MREREQQTDKQTLASRKTQTQREKERINSIMKEKNSDKEKDYVFNGMKGKQTILYKNSYLQNSHELNNHSDTQYRQNVITTVSSPLYMTNKSPSK